MSDFISPRRTLRKPWERREGSTKVRIITARANGTCRICGEAIVKGTHKIALTLPDRDWVHAGACFQQHQEAQQQS